MTRGVRDVTAKPQLCSHKDSRHDSIKRRLSPTVVPGPITTWVEPRALAFEGHQLTSHTIF
eukprot:scaffold137301_cov17-Tisochrysis_lutea.AAC.1